MAVKKSVRKQNEVSSHLLSLFQLSALRILTVFQTHEFCMGLQGNKYFLPPLPPKITSPDVTPPLLTGTDFCASSSSSDVPSASPFTLSWGFPPGPAVQLFPAASGTPRQVALGLRRWRAVGHRDQAGRQQGRGVRKHLFHRWDRGKEALSVLKFLAVSAVSASVSLRGSLTELQRKARGGSAARGLQGACLLEGAGA